MAMNGSVPMHGKTTTRNAMSVEKKLSLGTCGNIAVGEKQGTKHIVRICVGSVYL